MVLEPNWEPERYQHVAQNPTKKQSKTRSINQYGFGSLFYWIFIDFGVKNAWILIEIMTHTRIKAKRPRAAKYCKYQYKLNVFWFVGVDLLTIVA